MDQSRYYFQWNWKTMCGDQGFIPWDNKTNDFGLCFQQLCLRFPIFVLFAVASSYFFGRPHNWYLRDRTQIYTIYIRCIVSLLLACLPVVHLYLIVKNNKRDVTLAYVLISCTECFTWVVHMGACLALRSKGGSSARGPLALKILWTMIFVLSVIWLKSNISSSNMTWAAIGIVLHFFYGLTLIPPGKSRPLLRPEEQHDMERRALLSDYSRFQEDSDPLALGRATEGANWLSKLTFAWVHVLISKGVNKKLCHIDDIFDLPSDICCEFISDDIEEKLRSRNNLWRALHSLYGFEFYSIGLFRLLADLAGFGGPLLLGGLLGTATNSGGKPGDPYFYATGLLLTTLLAAFCNAHFNFRMTLVGLRIRSAIVSTVYRKVLEVRDGALGTGGQALNYMSTDAERIVNSCASFHAFWSIPFQLFVTLYLLYTQLGLAFLGGVGIAIVLIPINRYVMTLIGSFSSGMLKGKDSRINATSELLRGIRSVKLFAWEDVFLTRIAVLRRIELTFLAKRKYLDAICVFLWACTPVFISLFTFSLYWWLDGELNARIVFTSVALLAMLIGPLNAFPWVMNGLVEAWVSLKRVQELVNMPEVDFNSYYTPLENESIAVSLQNASFSFYFDREGKENQCKDLSEHGTLSIRSDGHFSEQKEFSLRDINLSIKKGELIGVIGPVGSGKSSLLLAMLGSMKKCQGTVSVDDYANGIAYVAQSPWLQRTSLRDAILFGRSLDEARYTSVLRACCLQQEMEDRVGVAEGGATLSGGQKARVALARAVYQENSVYLLDNILCSLDATVATHIARFCVLGLLKHKTRIVVTSHRGLLLNCDKIIEMSNGRIVSFGTPAEVLGDIEDIDNADGYFKNNDNSKTPSDNSSEVNLVDNVDTRSMDSVLEEESVERGTLHSSVIWGYWLAAGPWLGGMVLLSVVLMQTSRNLSDAWLAHWVSEANPEPSNITDIKALGEEPISNNTETVTFYLEVYAGLTLLNAIFTLIRAFLFAYAGIKAAKFMHARLLNAIIYAKVYFFDVTPLGRILNRFSSDTNTIDDSLPFILNILLAQFAGLLGSIILTLYAMPWLALLVCPLVPLYHKLQARYRACSREIKRLSSRAMSPLYNMFTETIHGLVTIRAMNTSPRFRRTFTMRLEDSLKIQINSVAASQWLGLRLQIIGALLTGGAGYLAAIRTNWGESNAALVGLAVSQALALSGLLSGLVNACAETEQELVAAERVLQYSKQRTREDEDDGPLDEISPGSSGALEVETAAASDDGLVEPPYGWPVHGIIRFDRVYLKYRAHLPASLRGISFETRSGERVGVVGRTGAGKSSLLAAIFRTANITDGRVLIDHVDAAHVSLRTLRSRIAVVPQEPFLFGGSVRDNLDPRNVHSDRDLWAALSRCYVSNLVTSLGGLDAAISSNSGLSVGQRQLLCLARALLRNSKIVCIDEATANIDPDTDVLIQRTLQSAFRSSTLLVIAHRIGNLQNYDRIIVMDNGQIIETGEPQKLLEDKKSLFSEMMKEEQSGHKTDKNS